MNDHVWKKDFTELRKTASKAVEYILMCSNLGCTDNYNNPTSLWRLDDEMKWCVKLKCSVCNNTWSVCYHCSKTKVRLAAPQQFRNHYNAYHNTSLALLRKRKTDCDGDTTTRKKNMKNNHNNTKEMTIEDNNNVTTLTVNNDVYNDVESSNIFDNDDIKPPSIRMINNNRKITVSNTINDTTLKHNDKDTTAYKILTEMQTCGMIKSIHSTKIIDAYQKLHNLVSY
jgi:hypothetical protein